MTREDAIREAQAMYRRGEIDADTLEIELAGIEYAHGEQCSAKDRRAAA